MHQFICMMACVETIPVPDSRQKVDELFLFWLSEPSTQEMLRKELSKVRGGIEIDEDSSYDVPVPTPPSVTSVPRPGSPTVRSPSPPPLLSRSPKSPRTKIRSRSPRRVQYRQGIAGDVSKSTKTKVEVIEEVDFPVESEQLTRPLSESPLPPIKVAENGEKLKDKDPQSTAPPIISNTIPRFYFPNGQCRADENVEKSLREVAEAFHEYPNDEVPLDEFHVVVKAMKLPLYWKVPLLKACSGGATDLEAVSYTTFKQTWQRVTSSCHDDASRFVQMLAGNGRNYLVEEDFEPLIQDVVDTHPGLSFLTSAPEFHARYVETVIGRIFYTVDRMWKDRITAAELRKSNFLQMLVLLEEEPDINQITDYFSYEHFYVIYCKFWELDSDHDLLIDAQDLSRHADHALTPRIIERVMSGVVSRDQSTPLEKLSYKDFIWFLLSEEDKNTHRSIEYWFRCMDLDGDGVLSLYELVYFYEEVLQRLQELNIDCLSVENTICQILDMVNPKEHGKITLHDLKVCKMTSVFYNTFINVDKYLEYEQRDPVAAGKDDGSDGELNDWDRYAAEQYEVLLAEEAYEQENDFEEEDTSDLEEDEKEMLDLLR